MEIVQFTLIDTENINNTWIPYKTNEVDEPIIVYTLMWYRTQQGTKNMETCNWQNLTTQTPL